MQINAPDPLVVVKSETAAGDDPTRLKRVVGGGLLFVFILGDVLGAGVYVLVGKIAGQVGGAVWAPLLVAMAFALMTAAAYAELVTKYPKAGASAVFALKAFKSPLIAFLVGFSMLAAGVTSAAGLSLAFAGNYLQTFVQVPELAASLVFLVLLALLNARGVRESLRANLVMTTVEVGGLVTVAVLGLWMAADGRGDASRLMQFTPGSTPAAAILAGAVLAFYSFVGFETSANMAEEVKDVSRVYPRALFGALLTAGVVYVGVAVAAALVRSPEALAASSSPLLDVVRDSGAAISPRVFSLVALIAVANGALLTMIMASRLAFGMAEEGLLPAPLARVLPKRGTPGVAIAVTTVVAAILALTGSVEKLAETVVLLLLFVFISVNAAVLVLRRDVVAHRHFRAPSLLPVLAIGSCVLLLAQQQAGTWLRAALLLGAGAALYGLRQWQQRRSAVRVPVGTR